MNTGKFIIGGVIGGVVSFFLGWLIYGMLLMDFMMQHTTTAGAGVMRGETGMIWWSLVLATLANGFILSYVLSKANVTSAAAGATTAAITGFLIAVGIDFGLYAQMNMFDITSAVVDIIASTVISAIVGAVIGWYLGRK